MLSEEEKKKIFEEEELRAKVRRKYEQKSSGTAGVLSTVCPGLGQIYNGQIGKGAAFFVIILVSLTLICLGFTLWIKGAPEGGEAASIVSEGKQVEISEDGVVEEAEEKESEEKESSAAGNIPVSVAVMTIVGLAGLAFGGGASVKDAVRTAKRLNEQ